MEEQSKNMKTVFTVVERGPGKSFWVRIGVGFENKDGSWNLRLDAIPISGKLQVRDWEPYDRREDAPRQDNAGGPPPHPRPRPQAPLDARDALL
jgi:hypothetical protein